MTTPDLIRIEVRDPPVERGAVVPLDTPVTGPFETWFTRFDPTRNVNDLAWTSGMGRKLLRFHDRRSQVYLNREPMLDPAKWGKFGDRSVVRVFYENDIYDHGFWNADRQSNNSGQVLPAVSMLHYIYLKLDGPLPQGEYPIIFPAGNSIPDTSFTFNDAQTRCPAIHTSFIGHRPKDVLKLGYLGIHVPGETRHGAVSYADDYGVSKFNIIDEAGQVVWTGPVTLRASPTDPEKVGGFPKSAEPAGTSRKWYADMRDPFEVTGHVPGNPARILCKNNLTENEPVMIGLLNGLTAVRLGSFVMAKNVTPDSFDVHVIGSGAPINTTGQSYTPQGPLLGAAVDKVYRAYVANATCTFTYGLDYSGFVPEKPGVYRLQIPGIGVSDPVPINEGVWHDAAAVAARGEYHLRAGCELDGRFGFKRGVALRHGQNGCRIFKSRFPIAWSSQGGRLNRASGGTSNINCSDALRSSWGLIGEEIDAGGHWMNAGDWDVLSAIQLTSFFHLANVWDLLPPAARNATRFNIPKSSHPTLYLGPGFEEIDGAPDIIHQCVYAIEWHRRCMDANGATPSGIQGTTEGKTAGAWDSSDRAISQWFTHLPDHSSNYIIAACMAILGRNLKEWGAPVLGQAYIDSAEKAFNWAEDIYQHLTGDKLLIAGLSHPFPNDSVVRGAESGATATVWTGGAQEAGHSSIMQVINRVGTFKSGEELIGEKGTRKFVSMLPNPVPFDIDYYYKDATDVKRVVEFTGDTHNRSYVIENIRPNTSGLRVGDHITGDTLPDGVLIKSIDGPHRITFHSKNDKIAADGELLVTVQGPSPYPAPAKGSGSGVAIKARAWGGGWNDQQYRANIRVTQGLARASRVYALGALSRATTKTSYRAEFEREYRIGNFLGSDALGRWEYINAPRIGATPSQRVVDDIKKTIVSESNRSLGGAETAQAYRILRAGLYNVNAHSGQIGACYIVWRHQLALAARDSTTAKRCLAAMQGSQGFTHGANQYGISYTRGIGIRQVQGALHDDGYLLGCPGGPEGITVYGPDWYPLGQIVGSYWLVWGNAILSCLNTAYRTSNRYNFDDKRVVDPHPYARPAWHMWDVRWIISSAEYGTIQSTLNEYFMMYLSGWDGNVPAAP